MGVEVNTSRVWARAEELELSRVVFVNMLDRERADFFRTLDGAAGAALRPLRRDPAPDRRRARADRRRRPAAQLRVHWIPAARARAIPSPIPEELADVAAEYREKLLDAVVETDEDADGALPRRRGARPGRDRRRAQDGGHERRAVPGRLRRRDEEPRHARAARPARRGRPVAGAQAVADRPPGGGTAAFVFKTVADPFAGRINVLPRLRRHGRRRLEAGQRCATTRRSASAA